MAGLRAAASAARRAPLAPRFALGRRSVAKQAGAALAAALAPREPASAQRQAWLGAGASAGSRPLGAAGRRGLATAADDVDADVERIADYIAQERCVLLDVRTPAEFAVGSVPGAVNIPLDELPQRIDEVPQGEPVAVFCKMGVRSKIAMAFLHANGKQAEDCLTVDYVAAAQKMNASE